MHIARRQFMGLCAGATAAFTGSRATKAQTTSLEVLVWGSGPRVVLVHGSINDGPATWAQQRPLGDRWRLEVVNRRGYGKSGRHQYGPISRRTLEMSWRSLVTVRTSSVIRTARSSRFMLPLSDRRPSGR